MKMASKNKKNSTKEPLIRENPEQSGSESLKLSSSKHHKIIRPIVIYPFSHPKDTRHLEKLYSTLIREISEDETGKYAKPVTVINRQTHYRTKEMHIREGNKTQQIIESYDNIRTELVEKYSSVIDSWSSDTCAMWLRGLGDAFCESDVDDIFWIIPGDFHYDTPSGEKAIKEMKKIPDNVYNGRCELCLGEIEVPVNSSKQLIDTYGTYGLLYNWFPAEAQGIRQITSKPRTEFFAIGHDFLQIALVNERWFAYEQTLIILLQNMRGQKPVRRVLPVELGHIEDDPASRSTLSTAMQQVERTERALKLFWRELNETKYPGEWPDLFRKLDNQSEQIRGAAMTIMQQLLG